MQIYEQPILSFTEALASKAAVPGGGSVAALAGSLSAALGSMAAALTSGKKKYAAYQADIERILEQSQMLSKAFLEAMEQDAQAFWPLSRAYGIPKTDPERPAIMEEALKKACEAPMAVVDQADMLLSLLEELSVKASRLVVSDVGVAAACCRCAVDSAVLNVYINTKMMTDRAYAEALEARAAAGAESAAKRSEAVYSAVLQELRRK